MASEYEDPDEHDGGSVDTKLALIRQRQRAYGKSLGCLRKNYVDHITEAVGFREEIRTDLAANRAATLALEKAFLDSEDSRLENSKALQEIRAYVTEKKTIEKINRKHIGIAVTVVGVAMSILAGSILFLSDVGVKLFKWLHGG